MADNPHIEIARIELAAENTEMLERVKIQASIADRALQSLIIANGGALIALFTLVGSAGSVHFDMHRLKFAFGSFAVGLMLTLAAHLFAFVSQDRFLHVGGYEASRHRSTIITGVPALDQSESIRVHGQGMRAYVIGLIVFALAMIAFVIGALVALRAVS